MITEKLEDWASEHNYDDVVIGNIPEVLDDDFIIDDDWAYDIKNESGLFNDDDYD